jgi:signal recognition particle GTPase
LFDRVRSLSALGAVNDEQLGVVEEVLLRSDVGLSATNEIVASLRESGAPQGVGVALRAALLTSLGADRSVRVHASEGRVPVWLFVGVNGVGPTPDQRRKDGRAGGGGHLSRRGGRAVSAVGVA